ncbi:MAG: CatB-related O-acetyltransferase [Gammaproteobacteria bacterium]
MINNIINNYRLRAMGIKLPRWKDISARSALDLEAPLTLGKIKIKAKNLSIGAHTYIRNGSELLAVDKIGRFCSIGKNVVLGLEAKGHPLDWLSTHPFQFDDKHLISPPSEKVSYATPIPPTLIGHDVWIGQQAMIMHGLNIGNGAVIGAGAIVTRDIPPYAIAAGNPARVLKYRFSPEIISLLQEVAWWDLSSEILAHLNFSNIQECLAQFTDLRRNGKNNYPCHYPKATIRNRKIYLIPS